MKRPEVHLFFCEKYGEDLFFEQMQNGKMLDDSLMIDIEMYEAASKYAKDWQKPHEFYESLRVDESYFYDDLVDALRQEKQK